MKNRVSIEIDAKNIGRAFAYTDDRAQAEMLNEMALELKACCRNEYDMQVCAFSKHLSKSAIKMIEDIKGFVDIRAEET